MKPATYSHTVTMNQPTIRRHDVYYPRGRFLTRLPLRSDPVAYIDRCIAEDKETRLRHINDYLAERAARPAPVVEPSNQLPLF